MGSIGEDQGVAWVNGFNLGRFRGIGPQKTLYVPGPFLREGLNEIVLFEVESALLNLASVGRKAGR
jgi:beta-galactosidase